MATSFLRTRGRRNRFGIGAANTVHSSIVPSILILSATAVASSTVMFPFPPPYGPQLLFLSIAAVIAAFVSVQVDRGTINLTAIPAQAAAIALPPTGALIVGFLTGCAVAVNRKVALSVATTLTWTTLPALVRVLLFGTSDLGVFAQFVTVVTFTLMNWLTVTLALHEMTGEPARAIWRRNWRPSWLAIFVYLCLAGVLLANLADGSVRGYVLGAIVMILSVALTDTISGRHDRALLQAALTDADRFVMAGRAVEGVAHTVRNHLSAALAHLEAIRAATLADDAGYHVRLSISSLADALGALNAFSKAAAPRVRLDGAAIKVSEIVRRTMLVAAPQAARAGVRLINRTDATTELEVQGDALLLREALMNLINNAIDATRPGGCVEIAYGMRHTRVYIAVADNGVGVSPENRQRLFEPHFTTKQSGSGMGLFTSFGIIREHRGRLLFDSRNPGSVFTIMLPIA